MTSTFTDSLSELQRQFTDKLPAQLKTIHTQFHCLDPLVWQKEEAESLQRLLHSLSNSANTFGMMSLSKAAHHLVSRLATVLTTENPPSKSEWQAIAVDIDQLEQLAQIPSYSSVPKLNSAPTAQHLNDAPLIYLLENDPVQAEQLSQALLNTGFRVQLFTELSTFRTRCATKESERPAVVIMEMVFPEGDSAGVEMLTELNVGQSVCPPVIFVSVRDDLPARLAAFRAGACRYMVKPVDVSHLIDQLNTLTGRQSLHPYRVLLVENEPQLLEAHSAILHSAGIIVHTLSQPLQILNAIDSFNPDVVVLDVYMPEANGPELAAVLREREGQLHLPILFLSGEKDITQQLLALDLGGDDFLMKPVQAEHLVAAVDVRAQRARYNSATQQRLETTLYERERELQAFDQHAIVSIADQSGLITYVNDKFCEISGYSRNELLGQNHRIVKSGRHSTEFYQNLWQTITQGKIWQDEICNRCKDGSLYWVKSTITPFLDETGKPYQYVSVRTDITERKLAEQQLEAHKERLRRGQIFANLGTWDWDIHNGDLFWSERIAPLFGYPAGDLETSYDNFISCIHPDDRQKVINAVNNCIDHGIPYEIEHRVVWPDGTVRWLLERGDVVRDDDDNATQMLGVVQDIDDRKRAELVLAERERQLREAQTLARFGNWMADLTTGELYWSDEIYRIFGHEPGSFAPSVEAFQSMVHPDDRAQVYKSEKLAEQTGHHDVIHRIVLPDGSIRHVHELAQAETDADGKLLRLTGTVQDITERVEAEARIHETEQRFAFAVEGAGDGVWDWDLSTNNMQFSRLYMEMLGYAENELPQNADTWINSIHPDDMALAQQKLQDYLENRESVYVNELRLRCKDGSYKWILCRGTTVRRNNEGKSTRMIGIHSDITERKQAEQALVTARDEADRANQAKSDFLSSMSHELRTPMNAILGFGQLMELNDTLPDEHKDYAQEILKAGNHLLELINDILDLAKVESGRIELSLEPVDVAPLITECLNLITSLADKRKIKLSHNLLNGAAVRADRIRLKQVLLNLLSNAIKYNREGGNVIIEVQPKGTESLHIRITDTGQGIPAERMTELFQPFNRLDAEDSNTEGTGIGLTITRRIIEIMGGNINVESEVGVGSTFWIELPLESRPASRPDDEHNSVGRVSDNSSQAPNIDTVQHIVLYIEDNPANLKLVAQILGRHPHIHLLTAHTPELGIALALERQPELILLDINMPNMDGYQVLEIFKASENLKNIPIVAITANAMPCEIEHGKVAGFTDYLTKPLDVVRFHAVIDKLLSTNATGGGTL